MNTTPENVLDETLIQAKVVCAQLLIKTNTLDIVREILHIYMIGLEIQTMQSGEFKLLVQLDMEDLFRGQSLATFGTPLTNRRYHRKTKTVDRCGH